MYRFFVASWAQMLDLVTDRSTAVDYTYKLLRGTHNNLERRHDAHGWRVHLELQRLTFTHETAGGVETNHETAAAALSAACRGSVQREWQGGHVNSDPRSPRGLRNTDTAGATHQHTLKTGNEGRIMAYRGPMQEEPTFVDVRIEKKSSRSPDHRDCQLQHRNHTSCVLVLVLWMVDT